MFGQGYVFLCYFLSVVIHEIGHYVFARRMGIGGESITLYPFGGEVKLSHINLSLYDEIKISLSGPLTNLCVASLVLSLNWIYPESYPYTQFFYTANIFNALLNLIPVYPLDGGRVLCALIKLRAKKRTAIKISMILGYIFCGALFIFGIFAMLHGNFSYVILSIFMFVCQMEMKFLGFENRYLNGNKQKIVESSGLKITHIMVPEDMIFYRLLSKTNNDSYFVFHVVDKDFNKKAVISESMLYDIATSKDIYLPIKDVICSDNHQ